ncbi:MAG: FtsW/RodA/SpoVE family cell cycle protein, partial [Phycisphaerae bacterium]
VGLLCTVSALALHVASVSGGGGGGTDYAALQLRYIGLGVLAIILMLLVHYEWFGRLAYIFMGIVTTLLALVLYTPASHGSSRWFPIGSFQLQPSEMAKIAFVLTVALFLRYRRNIRQTSGLIGPFLIMLVPCALVLKEPDLGTALLFPLVLYAMLIAAGARIYHLLLVALLALVMLPGAYFLLEPYQKTRIRSVYVQAFQHDNPAAMEQHRRTFGYQGHASKTAIAGGGLSGHGVQGADLIRRGLLPEAHTDFVYAVVGSQWGFLGSVGVILLYLAFLGAGMEIAASTKDPFGRLTAIGIVTLITFQGMINIAMTIGLGPVVGIALPFISYGGASMVTNMVAAGILLNISVRRRTKTTGLSLHHAAA